MKIIFSVLVLVTLFRSCPNKKEAATTRNNAPVATKNIPEANKAANNK
jgi:hypothetical protein